MNPHDNDPLYAAINAKLTAIAEASAAFVSVTML
jgi:hypothetical protein